MAYLPSDNPASLVAWFRKGVGVTVTGSGVSAWADQSGNGNNLLQATDTKRPIYDGSAVITFDGVAQFLKCAAFTLNQPTQISILASQVSWSLNREFFDGNTTANTVIQQTTSSPRIRFFAGVFLANSASMTVGSFFAVTSLANGASSSFKIGSDAEITGNAGTNNMGGFTLGCDGSTISAFANISVKEIIIRNVNDATIRANDHAYLLGIQNDVTPVAAFSGTPTSGDAPLSVTFTDASTNSPNTWAWDFGDGGTSTSQNPTHNYASAGTYTVTLTASNYAGSDSEVKTGYITVTTPASTDTPRGTVGGLAPYKGHEVRKRTKEEIRQAREKFGVLPRRIIEKVATRQAERLETDQQKILDELHRELQISKIEWDARYLAALNELRTRLIEEEIGRRLKLKLMNQRTAAILLMAAAA